jgi:hypothetical protein
LTTFIDHRHDMCDGRLPICDLTRATTSNLHPYHFFRRAAGTITTTDNGSFAKKVLNDVHPTEDLNWDEHRGFDFLKPACRSPGQPLRGTRSIASADSRSHNP